MQDYLRFSASTMILNTNAPKMATNVAKIMPNKITMFSMLYEIKTGVGGYYHVQFA